MTMCYTKYFLAWYLSGVIGAIIMRVRGRQKLPIYLYMFGGIFGALTLGLSVFVLLLDDVWPRILNILNKEI